ncbi:MAG TPA: hypothetical protein VI039_11900 [Solirubrobacterales bacterium]
MKARGLLALLACAVAALALAGSATAKPGYFVEKPVRLVFMQLQASNGYRAHLFGFNRRQVSISVSDDSASASYSVRGRVTDEEIEARFGSRGRLRLRFEPDGPTTVQKVSSKCKGKPSIDQEGHFVGQLRFEGENGFTRVRATRAKGFVLIGHRVVCKRDRRRKADRSRPRVEATSLGATSSTPRAPWYSVVKEKSRRPAQDSWVTEEAIHTAAVTERRPGMVITRSATAVSPPETFAVTPIGETPITATISPPAPFSGTATYEKRADGTTSWSGDLRTELPGRGVVSLVDPTYRAELCRSVACFCPAETCGLIIAANGRAQPLQLRRLGAQMRP